MDVAREGFVRSVALGKWRDVQALRETGGLDWAASARQAGVFLERGPYQALWVKRWEEHVLGAGSFADVGALFAAIERAVAAAVQDEVEARRARGDRPLDEDPQYREFVDVTLGRLARAVADGYESNQ
jgi:hypothetical protein